MEHNEAGKRATRAKPEMKKPSTAARVASAASTIATAVAGWYIRTQGGECTLLESQERPTNEPGEGEHLINLLGPFQDREKAEKIHARMSSTLLGARPRERGRSEA